MRALKLSAGLLALLGLGVSQTLPRPSRVFLYDFQFPVKTAAASAPNSCQGAASASGEAQIDPQMSRQLIAALRKQLALRLRKHYIVSPSEAGVAPPGSLVIKGCIVKAEQGSMAGRMVGFGLGSSHLSVHTEIAYKTETGFTPVDDFVAEVAGGHKLPPLGPIGLAAHAVTEPRETLTADARKMAERISKRLAKKAKELGWE